MPHPLEQKLVALRHRVRWMTAVYASSIVAAALLATVTALGALDYVLRFQDRGLRIIASLSLLGVAAWMLYRYVVTVLLVPLRNADLALGVQRRFPSLSDGLIRAVEFLDRPDDDAMAGSAALRRTVVDQITTAAQPLHFDEVIDSRPTIHAVLCLSATCLIAGVLLVLSPAATGIAIARLINPLGDASWPRANHLAIRHAQDRVARGQTFQVEVVDNAGARLPRDICIHYRFDRANAGAVEETELMSISNGVAVATRDNILRPFSYRVEGGDDQSLPWLDVAVSEPPAIASTAIEIVPPSYTGWPTTQAKGHIRALVGSDVHITVTSTKPLQSAVLSIDDAVKLPAQLLGDGRTFTVTFQAEHSGSYWFDLLDREGFAGGSDDRWEIRAIADSPPSVSIEQPALNLFVTPRATVPLQVLARDDLAIRDIAILFHRNEFNSEERLPLWTRRNRRQPRSADVPAGESRTVMYDWDLGCLNLEPHTQLTFLAVAADDLLQRGQSEPRSLTVVTADELQDHLAVREKAIRAELQAALTMQRGCHQQVTSLRTNLIKRRQIGPPDVDMLRVAQQNQTDVEQALTSRRDGVRTHALALLADLRNNHIETGDTRQRLSALLEDIDRIERQHLPLACRELLSAVKASQVALEGQGGVAQLNAEVVTDLASAITQQEAVIASIEQMLGQLAKSDAYRRFLREMAVLLRQQEDVARRTAEVGRRTLTQEIRDLAPKDLADLTRAAEQQLELARSLDRLLQETEQPGADSTHNNAAIVAALSDSLALARRLAVGMQMRSVGQQIEQNHIGQAAGGQKRIALDLQQVLAVLAARHRNSDEEPDHHAVSDSAIGQSKVSDAKSPSGTPPSRAATPKQTRLARNAPTMHPASLAKTRRASPVPSSAVP